MDEAEDRATGGNPMKTLLLVGGLVALIGLGYGAYRVIGGPGGSSGAGAAGGGPTAADVEQDPFLKTGQAVYVQRCVSCHGPTGKGDGPIATQIGTPGPGDLTDDQWKYGDRPEQVLGVIAEGIPKTSMTPWKSMLDDNEQRAVSAYMYVLANRRVPDALRRR